MVSITSSQELTTTTLLRAGATIHAFITQLNDQPMKHVYNFFLIRFRFIVVKNIQSVISLIYLRLNYFTDNEVKLGFQKGII